jgi:hypothetical protein
MKLSNKEIPVLRYFYIHPSRYFHKDGLCEYLIKEDDSIMQRDTFDHNLTEALQSEKPEEQESSSAKQQKLEVSQLWSLIIVTSSCTF